MKPAELLLLLHDFYREKLALLQEHEESARRVGQYDFNNTYQNVIGREEVQVTWLAAAIRDLGGSVQPEPTRIAGDDAAGDVAPSLFVEDSRRAQQFVDTWRDRLDAISHARHRGMLQLILGETLEHKRFFDQAAAGRLDLLGRGGEGAGQRGRVLPTRWLE